MARILVGVTGSVAAIKTTQLIEALGGKGYELRLVFTRAADYFLPEWQPVRPSDRVGVFRDADEWPKGGWKRGDDVTHIELRRWADVLVVAPLVASSATFGSKTVTSYGVNRSASRGRLDFATAVAAKIIPYYENLFEAPFPLPKMDMVALPDFAAGA